jgi:hypothetical protein
MYLSRIYTNMQLIFVYVHVVLWLKFSDPRGPMKYLISSCGIFFGISNTHVTECQFQSGATQFQTPRRSSYIHVRLNQLKAHGPPHHTHTHAHTQTHTHTLSSLSLFLPRPYNYPKKKKNFIKEMNSAFVFFFFFCCFVSFV